VRDTQSQCKNTGRWYAPVIPVIEGRRIIAQVLGKIGDSISKNNQSKNQMKA
jgi:hypothetical protein